MSAWGAAKTSATTLTTTNPIRAASSPSVPMSASAPAPGAAPAAAACCSPTLVRKLMVVGYLTLATYTCFIGTFLAVFVPQRCTTVLPAAAGAGNATVVASECTFAQNVYEDIDAYNTGALLLNLATFLVLMCGFYLEFQREKWIIHNLDADPAKPDNNLASELTGDSEGLSDELKTELFRTLRLHNRKYKVIFEVILFFMIANAVVSGVLVFLYWFQDVRGPGGGRAAAARAAAPLLTLSPSPPPHPPRSTAPSPRTSLACSSWAAAWSTRSPCPRTAKRTTWRSR